MKRQCLYLESWLGRFFQPQSKLWREDDEHTKIIVAISSCECKYSSPLRISSNIKVRDWSSNCRQGLPQQDIQDKSKTSRRCWSGHRFRGPPTPCRSARKSRGQGWNQRRWFVSWLCNLILKVDAKKNYKLEIVTRVIECCMAYRFLLPHFAAWKANG